jgi:hypothetical protein
VGSGREGRVWAGVGVGWAVAGRVGGGVAVGSRMGMFGCGMGEVDTAWMAGQGCGPCNGDWGWLLGLVDGNHGMPLGPCFGKTGRVFAAGGSRQCSPHTLLDAYCDCYLKLNVRGGARRAGHITQLLHLCSRCICLIASVLTHNVLDCMLLCAFAGYTDGIIRVFTVSH